MQRFLLLGVVPCAVHCIDCRVTAQIFFFLQEFEILLGHRGRDRASMLETRVLSLRLLCVILEAGKAGCFWVQLPVSGLLVVGAGGSGELVP